MPGPRVFADPFGNDVAGSRQGVFHGGHVFTGIYKGPGPFGRITLSLGHEDLRQRLKATFPGNGCAGASFRAVRQIEVLQGRQVRRFQNLLPQVVREQSLLLNGRQHGVFSFVKLLQALMQIPDGGNLHFVE